MKIEYWSESEVNEDGTIGFGTPNPALGSVSVEPGMNTSGMHHAQTPSTVRSGLWMNVSTGRLPDGTMHGITLYFDNEREMREFGKTRKCRFFPDFGDDGEAWKNF